MDQVPMNSPASPASQTSSAGTSRRNLVRGVAWTTPVIAAVAAAPAFAASCPTLGPHVFAIGSKPVGSRPTSFTAAGSSTTMSVAYSGATSDPFLGVVTPGPDAGLPGPYLNLSLPAGNNTVTVTLTFSAPVTNVSFTVGDIDSAPGAPPPYREGLVASGYSGATLGANISGTGTTADPWKGPPGVGVPASSMAGNVTLSYAGPISVISFSMVDVSRSRQGGHSMDLFDVSFTGC